MTDTKWYILQEHDWESTETTIVEATSEDEALKIADRNGDSFHIVFVFDCPPIYSEFGIERLEHMTNGNFTELKNALKPILNNAKVAAKKYIADGGVFNLLDRALTRGDNDLIYFQSNDIPHPGGFHSDGFPAVKEYLSQKGEIYIRCIGPKYREIILQIWDGNPQHPEFGFNYEVILERDRKQVRLKFKKTTKDRELAIAVFCELVGVMLEGKF